MYEYVTRRVPHILPIRRIRPIIRQSVEDEALEIFRTIKNKSIMFMDRLLRGRDSSHTPCLIWKAISTMAQGPRSAWRTSDAAARAFE
jgi:hypothetical protein